MNSTYIAYLLHSCVHYASAFFCHPGCLLLLLFGLLHACRAQPTTMLDIENYQGRNCACCPAEPDSIYTYRCLWHSLLQTACTIYISTFVVSFEVGCQVSLHNAIIQWRLVCTKLHKGTYVSINSHSLTSLPRYATLDDLGRNVLHLNCSVAQLLKLSSLVTQCRSSLIFRVLFINTECN